MRRNAQSEEVRRELEIVDAVVRGGADARPEDAELVEFALSVRETRPVLDHGAAVRLDERIASAPPRKARRSVAMKPVLGGLAALMLLAGVVTTQTDLGGFNSTETLSSNVVQNDVGAEEPFVNGQVREDGIYGAGAKVAPSEQSQTLNEFKSKYSTERSAAMSSPGPAANTDRVQAQDASITLATTPDDFESKADDVIRIADRSRGFVERSSVRTSGANKGRATFLLMIPSGRLQDTLSELSNLGNVRSRSQGVEDITAQFNAAERTLAARRAVVRSLERELSEATSAAERAKLERQLAVARVREKRATQSARVMRTRANYVPVNVKLVANKRAAEADKGAVAKSFDRAGEILEAMLAIAIVALALVLPIALALAIAIWLVRSVQRRRALSTLEASAAQPEKR